MTKGTWTGLKDDAKSVSDKARTEALDFENFRQKTSQVFRSTCEADRTSNRFCDLAITPEAEKTSNAVPVETRRKLFDVLKVLDDKRGRAQACPKVTADLEALLQDDGAKILHSRARYWLWACAKLGGDGASAANWRDELWQHHPFSHLAFEAMTADDDGRWAEALTAPEKPWVVEARVSDDEELNDVIRGIEALIELGKDGAAAVALKRHQDRFAQHSPELQLYIGGLAARVALKSVD